MSGLLRLLALVALFLLGARQVVATQLPDSTAQEVILRDGTHAVGHAEAASPGLLRFRTLSGALLEVEEDQVLSLRPLAAAGTAGAGPAWPEDPNATRLFFAPNARSLKRGTASFGLYEVLFPNLQVGLSDRISLGGGLPLFFADGMHVPVWITPKLQVLDLEHCQAALGVFQMLGIGQDGFGMAYGVLTLGAPDRSLTAGWGTPYYGVKGSGIGLVGGEFRLSRRLKLVTENYVASHGGLACLGLRWMSDRLSADLGLAAPLGGGGTFIFPMMNFVYSFPLKSGR